MLKVPWGFVAGCAAATALLTGPIHASIWSATDAALQVPGATQASVNVTRADEHVSIFANSDNLGGATRAELSSFAPDLTFVDALDVSSGPQVASVFSSDSLNVVAVSSERNACEFVIRVDRGDVQERIRNTTSSACSADSVIAVWQSGDVSPSA